MKCMFLVNARRETLGETYLQNSRCAGYLFPPDGATKATVQTLATRSRVRVLSDNGAFEEIGRLALLPREVTGSADERWKAAMNLIKAAAALVDSTVQIDQQLAVNPDAIIGAEDVTLASWIRAKVEEKYLRSDRRGIAIRNRIVALRGKQLEAEHPALRVYSVASAHDYDTAFDAGKAFADANVQNVAMGFGAFMADDQWGEDVKVRGRVRRLPRSLPMRYLRTALVARGFFDGWRTMVAGGPKAFHFLGLGAPVMIPMAVLAANRVEQVSFDATSPIRDAVQGSIYVNTPAPLTLRLWKLGQYYLLNEGTEWDCRCYFCTIFRKDHPFSVSSQLRSKATSTLTAADLRAGTKFAASMPFLRLSADSTGKTAEQARIGHNHWVLGTLTSRLQEKHAELVSFVDKLVSTYEENAGAAHFGQAVRLSFDIVNPNSTYI